MATGPVEGHDVFISHAGEDKEAVARPLANALRSLGYRVWCDEFELTGRPQPRPTGIA